MAQRHLKELLKEDQEPFQLQDYIADKKCLLKNKQQQNLQLKKQSAAAKPISRKTSKNTSFLCKNACFFSLQDSPDLRKSPLFDFTSPVSRSPCKSPNRVFLHVPAKTASLLLEAAMRIQKQSKPKTQIKNSGFGLFGSMLKRLKNRSSRTQKIKGGETGERKTEERETEERNEVVLVNVGDEKLVISSSSSSSSSSASSSSSSCSCNGRLSSLDLESSSSGRSFNGDEDEDEDDGFEFANVVRENNIGGDYGFCLSPLSPFRFALHKSPSPLSSPAKSSPSCRNLQDNVNYEEESSVKIEEDDEEDKEQNSPVSVLDPPFEDDYDGHDEDVYDVDECSYAFVQRAKQHLLHKLHRFEKLAELDPIELEKRMIEEEDSDNGGLMLEQAKESEEYDYESFMFDEQRQVEKFVEEVMRQSGFREIKKPGMKRLVSDLIIEEESNKNTLESDDQLIKRVCKRLESWKEVESNTIDMMVEMDLRREIDNWKKPQEQISEVATNVEVAIFAVLVEELLDDLA